MRGSLGKEFTKLEIKIFRAKLLQNYTWELLSNQNLSIDPIPVPLPIDGLVTFSHFQSKSTGTKVMYVVIESSFNSEQRSHRFNALGCISSVIEVL